MAFVQLLVVAILVFLAANGVAGFDIGGGAAAAGDLEERELFGLFEVMGSLLEDPTWAQMHPLPCTDTPWPGVECELLQETSTSIFHVTKIHVGEDIITPPCKASAKLSLSLSKLPFLKTLSLITCFTKSPLFFSHPLFASLSSLEHLVLESNPTLSGEIPSSISNLKNLKILTLSQNNLTGEIPKQIATLLNLEQLDLSHNNFIGPIPQEIGKLSKLTILDMSWNNLHQTVPTSLGSLQLLEKIDLSSNKLQGKLPQDLGKLRRVVLFDLSHNFITGPIPESLSGLEELQYFVMEGNPVNSSIPLFICSLAELRVLSFSGCGLTGPIPSMFSNLKKLAALSVDDNRLNGTVPQELGLLQSLNALNLSRNCLSGEILFSEDFVNRLGQRLDFRENNGLSLRLLQKPTRNKTLVEKNPVRSEKLKPTKTSNSGEKLVFFPGLVTVFVVWFVIEFIGLYKFIWELIRIIY